jgi:hypothetical protein
MNLSSNVSNLIVTYDASLNVTGTITSQFSRTINLRQIIGPEYDTCEFFELSFNNYSSSNFIDTIFTNELGALSTSMPLKMGVSGLPFVQNSLNGQLSNLGLFAPVFLVGGHPTSLNATFRANNFQTPKFKSIKFRKPINPDVTLTFAFYTIRLTGSVVSFRNSTAAVDISQILCFTISPCENEVQK